MTNDRPVHLVAQRQVDHWLVSFDISRGQLSPDDLIRVQIPQDEMSTDLGIVITGRGPVWLYAYLIEKLSAYPWLATFDAGMNCPVVVKSSVGNGPRVGDLLPEGSTGRRPGVALAVVGYPHRGKSVLVAGFQELLRAYRDNQWHIIRPHADGEGQWVHQANAETVENLRLKRPWTADVVARMAEDIRALRSSRELVVVDTGGKDDDITASLLRQCTHALILVTATVEGDAEYASWSVFCEEAGVAVLGSLRTRRDDVPTSVAVLRGTIHGTVGNMTRTSVRSVQAIGPVLDASLQSLRLTLQLR